MGNFSGFESLIDIPFSFLPYFNHLNYVTQIMIARFQYTELVSVLKY